MGFVRIEGPTDSVVTAEQVRHALRIDDEFDDPQLTLLIAAASRQVEQATGRALLTQRWCLELDGFPCSGKIPITKSPLQSVEVIQYFGASGVQVGLDSSGYIVDTSSMVGSVVPAVGKAWPASQKRPGAVRIEFTCGYGVAEDIEPDIVLAVMLLIGHFYVNREAVSARQLVKLPIGVDELLAPYVIPGG